MADSCSVCRFGRLEQIAGRHGDIVPGKSIVCRRDQHYETKHASDWCGNFEVGTPAKPAPDIANAIEEKAKVIEKTSAGKL